jgi:nucleoside-diphosphate-sugar epimerase
MKGLIGKGFVGNNLLEQTDFDFVYDSKNIKEIRGKEFDLLVVAAPSAVKWLANKEPAKDLESINSLIMNLKSCKAKKVIHISTIDVYKNPINVNENSIIETDGLCPYGLNRYYLENVIKNNFSTLTIRLPALFGNGLKKNFIYDILNNNCLELTNKNSTFQLYYIKHLWKDINYALNKNISLLNITSPPITAEFIANVFGIYFNHTTAPIVNYDVKSLYKRYSKKHIVKDLKEYETSNI